MMMTLKSGIIGVHFFCFRTVNEVTCMVEKGFEVGTISGEFLMRELAAEGAPSKRSLVAKLIPEPEAWLDLFSELRQGSEIAPHEAHDLP